MTLSSAKKRLSHKREAMKDAVIQRNDTTSIDNLSGQPWTPTGYTVFKILMSARLCAAVWSVVGDCDETYNYWEPTHFLLYGRGFQTWEYSPMYAIRSYAYLWLHVLPLHLYSAVFGANTIVLFYLLRCILAVICAVSEVYFYKGVCNHFGANTGRITLCFLLVSAGMFISCSAYLPSSFCMYMTLIAMGGWFLRQYNVAILAIAASGIIGWPFAGILGVPIALDIVIRKKKLKLFIIWVGVGLAVFLLPSVQVDSAYYGKLVIAPLNIVIYNVLTDHGPDLYGTEPVSFYFINAFLNFNIAFILALVCLPLVAFVQWLLKIPNTYIPQWLSTLPLYIWLLIFFTRPHKEERFLFPVYPLFALCGAISIDYLQKLLSFLLPKKSFQHYTHNTNFISVCACFLFALLSISRILAVYKGFHAPLDVFVELNRVANDPKIHTLSSDRNVNLCVGKEWYRFPSSFFLPAENWNLQFIESEFRGQLPKPYSAGPNSTKIVPTDMNDMNKEEPSRYISITKCHYLIDLDTLSKSQFEPRYSQQTDEWKVLFSMPFLDAMHSSRLLRAFYIPWFSSQYCTFSNYNLLKTTRTKKTVKSKSDR